MSSPAMGCAIDLPTRQRRARQMVSGDLGTEYAVHQADSLQIARVVVKDLARLSETEMEFYLALYDNARIDMQICLNEIERRRAGNLFPGGELRVIDAQVIQDLKAQIVLSDWLEQDGVVVERRRRGEHSAYCLFHNDGQNPSMRIDDKKGVFHCHQCGRGGDVIYWEQSRYDLPFMTAVRKLAAAQGFTLPSPYPDEIPKSVRRLLADLGG